MNSTLRNSVDKENVNPGARSTTKKVEEKLILFSNGQDGKIPKDHYYLFGHPEHKPTGTTEVLTFYPTMEEMENFPRFVRKMERQSAHVSCGIAKVVPPPEWSPRPTTKNESIYEKVGQLEINKAFWEEITRIGTKGAFFKGHEKQNKPMTVKDFEGMAKKRQTKYPDLKDGADIEKKYWKKITGKSVCYALDVEATLFDPDSTFNVGNLGTILGRTKEVDLKGVMTPYLYIGMDRTSFAMHAEDLDLYSINFVHHGAPKYWWAIPESEADKFEKFARAQFEGKVDISGFENQSNCEAFLLHKNYIICPTMLRDAGIKYGSMIQRPGEFIITFPRGYHQGFNMGYNVAESTNFASERWIPYGVRSATCTCMGTPGKPRMLNMESYMRLLPEEYSEEDIIKYLESEKRAFDVTAARIQELKEKEDEKEEAERQLRVQRNEARQLAFAAEQERIAAKLEKKGLAKAEPEPVIEAHASGRSNRGNTKKKLFDNSPEDTVAELQQDKKIKQEALQKGVVAILKISNKRRTTSMDNSTNGGGPKKMHVIAKEEKAPIVEEKKIYLDGPKKIREYTLSDEEKAPIIEEKKIYLDGPKKIREYILSDEEMAAVVEEKKSLIKGPKTGEAKISIEKKEPIVEEKPVSRSQFGRVRKEKKILDL